MVTTHPPIHISKMLEKMTLRPHKMTLATPPLPLVNTLATTYHLSRHACPCPTNCGSLQHLMHLVAQPHEHPECSNIEVTPQVNTASPCYQYTVTRTESSAPHPASLAWPQRACVTQKSHHLIKRYQYRKTNTIHLRLMPRALSQAQRPWAEVPA